MECIVNEPRALVCMCVWMSHRCEVLDVCAAFFCFWPTDLLQWNT